MKITKVTPLLIDRYLFIEVETDEGIKGLGESGAWGFLEASAACIESFSRILIGTCHQPESTDTDALCCLRYAVSS